MEDTYNESTMNGNGNDPRDPYAVVRRDITSESTSVISSIVIDMGIPIPPKLCGPRPRKDISNIEIALCHMNVGDSILIPNELVGKTKSVLTRFSKMRRLKKQGKGAKYKFLTRQIQRKNPAFRVWRVK